MQKLWLFAKILQKKRLFAKKQKEKSVHFLNFTNTQKFGFFKKI
jgi:hypothetical protein